MSDTNTDMYFGIQTLFTGNINTILIASFLNAFASLLTKIEIETLLVGYPNGFNKVFMASNKYWFVVYY